MLKEIKKKIEEYLKQKKADKYVAVPPKKGDK